MHAFPCRRAQLVISGVDSSFMKFKNDKKVEAANLILTNFGSQCFFIRDPVHGPWRLQHCTWSYFLACKGFLALQVPKFGMCEPHAAGLWFQGAVAVGWFMVPHLSDPLLTALGSGARDLSSYCCTSSYVSFFWVAARRGFPKTYPHPKCAQLAGTAFGPGTGSRRHAALRLKVSTRLQ